MAKRVTIPKFIQISIAQYEPADGGLNYQEIALDASGLVWRYEHKKNRWTMYTTLRGAAHG